MQKVNQNNDLSFLEKRDPNALSFKDVLFTILRNIHWLILCGAIGGAVGWYYADHADRIYESHAKIKVYEMTESTVTSQLESIVNVRYGTASRRLNDEIIILNSESAMLEVVKRLNLNTYYLYKTKIVKRRKDLYKDSPIDVKMPDLNERDYATFTVAVSRDSIVTVNIGEDEEVKGRLRQDISTSIGRVIVEPTWAFREVYFDTPITVQRQNIYDVVARYRGAVKVTRGSDSEGILNLSLNDKSSERAADILNALITVYNEHAIEERQAVILQTSEYINDRIAQLDAELGSQEAQIANFKRENQLLSVEDYGQSYLATSKESAEEAERLRAQISHAQYLQSLTASNTDNKLFPVTIDIEDENIKSTIAEFNALVLKLDKYKESGTTNNPVVQSMQLELTTLKTNLNQLLASFIGAIQQKIGTV